MKEKWDIVSARRGASTITFCKIPENDATLRTIGIGLGRNTNVK